MAWMVWGQANREVMPQPALGPDKQGKEVGLKDTSLSPHTCPQKLIQTTRDEVNACFSEIIQEIKQMQMKVLDFVEKEEAAALGKLGGSIQQSHNRLLKLEGDSIWLRSLLANRSDQQFLQARPLPTPTTQAHGNIHWAAGSLTALTQISEKPGGGEQAVWV